MLPASRLQALDWCVTCTGGILAEAVGLCSLLDLVRSWTTAILPEAVSLCSLAVECVKCTSGILSEAVGLCSLLGLVRHAHQRNPAGGGTALLTGCFMDHVHKLRPGAGGRAKPPVFGHQTR